MDDGQKVLVLGLVLMLVLMPLLDVGIGAGSIN